MVFEPRLIFFSRLSITNRDNRRLPSLLENDLLLYSKFVVEKVAVLINLVSILSFSLESFTLACYSFAQGTTWASNQNFLAPSFLQFVQTFYLESDGNPLDSLSNFLSTITMRDKSYLFAFFRDHEPAFDWWY